jgi:hypothetical protein
MRKKNIDLDLLKAILLWIGGISVGVFLLGSLITVCICSFVIHWLFGVITTTLVVGILCGAAGLALELHRL